MKRAQWIGIFSLLFGFGLTISCSSSSTGSNTNETGNDDGGNIVDTTKKTTDCEKTACGCIEGCVEGGFSIDDNGFSLDGTTAYGDPFSDGVSADPDEGLTLSSTQVNTAYIWVANSGQGTISKVNISSTSAEGEPPTFVEEARYATGPQALYSDSNLYGWLSGEDPSRTTVNRAGDVYIGNRAGGSITKVSVRGNNCKDNNDDSVITTSTGPNDILPWGDDELHGGDDCIMWRSELSGAEVNGTTLGTVRRIRAMAAQDVAGLDFQNISYVWIGDTDYKANGTNNGAIWKMDGETGETLFMTRVHNCRPYGFAIDGNKNLWISCRSSRRLARVDTTRCIDASCLDEPTCEGMGMQNGIDCDTAIKQVIQVQNETGGNSRYTYGITVDVDQRVWLGSDGFVYRYNPKEADSSKRWNAVNTGTTRGITADLRGFIYAAREGNPIMQIDSNTLTTTTLDNTNGNASWGMAVDSAGKVWSIGKFRDHPIVFTPSNTQGVMEQEAVLADSLNFASPYTYSDMTGTQLRFATNPDGYVRTIFEGCATGTTQWVNMAWDATIPQGTRIVIFARAAESEVALDDESWTNIAEIIDQTSPMAIQSIMEPVTQNGSAYVEVEMRLISDVQSSSVVITPSLRSLNLGYTCQSSGILQ